MSNITQEASLIGYIKFQENLLGHIQPQVNLSGRISMTTIISPEIETKIITPNATIQEVTPSEGKLLSKVTVGAIPNNYGLITYNGFEITVS